jgi:hypothetical protein
MMAGSENSDLNTNLKQMGLSTPDKPNSSVKLTQACTDH